MIILIKRKAFYFYLTSFS